VCAFFDNCAPIRIEDLRLPPARLTVTRLMLAPLQLADECAEDVAVIVRSDPMGGSSSSAAAKRGPAPAAGLLYARAQTDAYKRVYLKLRDERSVPRSGVAIPAKGSAIGSPRWRRGDMRSTATALAPGPVCASGPRPAAVEALS
jgi:hypothetical protein